MNQSKNEYSRKELPANFAKAGYILSSIGLVAVVIAFMTDSTRATFDSLMIFTFLMGIGMCSLFLVALEYITDAVWSVAFRRISEFLSPLIFIAPIFAIPVLLNMHDVFHWSHTEAVVKDAILSSKSGYLNFNFFLIRFLVIIVLMGIFYFIMLRNSNKQDKSGDQKLTKTNIKYSAVFIPVFGISISIFAMDWVMSIEAHWFSTIFGVYYFSGSLLASFAFLTLIAVKLKEWKILPEFLARDHFYNLGAFMFAFVNFWTYIAFSQLLLIWYANLPEETYWFLQKFHGSWLYVSVGMILVQFIIPYAGLLSQPSKSNYKRLKIMSIWIIFAHLYDLYWLIMPTFNKAGAFFGWQEIAFIMLGAGVVIITFKIFYDRKNLIPVGDPKLIRCENFHL